MASVVASPPRPPRTVVRRPRVLRDRETQTVLQLKGRLWQAKLRTLDRIEKEEDRLWGLYADWIEANTPDETVPWEVVKRELGLDRLD